MLDMQAYKIAKLSDDNREKLSELEEKLREMTGNEIVLVAYVAEK